MGLDRWNRIDPAGDFFIVIPGHREAISPESMLTIGRYGFRASAKWRIPE
jgi:hypothetical protein